MKMICHDSLCGDTTINTMCLLTCMVLVGHCSLEGSGDRQGTDDHGENTVPAIDLPQERCCINRGDMQRSGCAHGRKSDDGPAHSRLLAERPCPCARHTLRDGYQLTITVT